MIKSMSVIKPVACLTAGIICAIFWLSQHWSIQMDLVYAMAIEICFLQGYTHFKKWLKNRSVK